MIHRVLSSVLLASAALLPSQAMAEASSPFAVPAVSDRLLSEISGTASPYASLSRGSLVRLADEQSRSDFRVAGSIAGLQMEVWWGTVGSELIANAVRNQGP